MAEIEISWDLLEVTLPSGIQNPHKDQLDHITYIGTKREPDHAQRRTSIYVANSQEISLGEIQSIIQISRDENRFAEIRNWPCYLELTEGAAEREVPEWVGVSPISEGEQSRRRKWGEMPTPIEIDGRSFVAASYPISSAPGGSGSHYLEGSKLVDIEANEAGVAVVQSHLMPLPTDEGTV